MMTEKPILSEAENVVKHTPEHLRFIHTFMRRRTHIGKKAQAGLTEAYAQFFVADAGKNNSHIQNLRSLFANPENPLTFEIGFGMGSSLVTMAKANPHRNFVGIEVHQAGLGNCAYLAGEAGLTNLKLLEGDAIALMQQLPSNHIDTIQLYFPDPWQKKRHYKRRFVSPERMAIVHRVMMQGGVFHVATDWEHYAFWILEIMDNLPEFRNMAGQGKFLPRPDFRPITKFEQRGIDEGRNIWDLMYEKI